MSRLLIIGAGGNGRVIADMAAMTGQWSHIAFLDAEPYLTDEERPWDTIGTPAELEDKASEFDAAVVGFGENELRSRWIDRVVESGLALATIIAPSAAVSERAHLGTGTVIMPQAAVNIGVRTGRCCIINTGASVDHDCMLGEAVHIAPGAHVGGDVAIGDRAWIGIGSAVRHGVSIGVGVTVGAGAAVVADLPDACTAVGVPARPRG